MCFVSFYLFSLFRVVPSRLAVSLILVFSSLCLRLSSCRFPVTSSFLFVLPRCPFFFFLKYLLFKQALLFDEQNAIESGSNSEYIRNVKDWRRRLERIETYRMYFFCFVASCCLALCQFVAYRRVPYLLFRSIYHIFRVITALFYRWYALIAGLRRSTPCWALRSGTNVLEMSTTRWNVASMSCMRRTRSLIARTESWEDRRPMTRGGWRSCGGIGSDWSGRMLSCSKTKRTWRGHEKT